MTAEDKNLTIQSLLMDLEYELRRLLLWQVDSPTPEALSSTAPFCVDTLSLPQWIQFIFLPRMNALLDSGSVLPEKCGVGPMAEEFFKGSELDIQALVKILDNIDDKLSNI